MKKIRLTESELMRMIKRIINEGGEPRQVSIDCAAGTIDGMALSPQQKTKYCPTGVQRTQGGGGAPSSSM